MKTKGIINKRVTAIFRKDGCMDLILKFEIDGFLKKSNHKSLYYIRTGEFGKDASLVFSRDCIKKIDFSGVIPKVFIDIV